MSNPHTQGTNEEIELKLALGEGAAEQLAKSPLLSSAPLKRMTLGNRYFDTAAADLRANKLALRIRKGEYDRFIQTLKSAGKSEGGLSLRGEWQWERDEESLDLSVLKGLAASDGQEQPGLKVLANETVLHQLKPVFITDFTRLAYTLEWHGARIELAIDQGTISVGHEHRAINEVELELKQGNPSVLWSLAETITQQVAARPANASKASRAAALMTQPLLPEMTSTTPPALFAAAITGLDTAQDAYIPAPGLTYAQAALAQLGEEAQYAEATSLAEQLGSSEWQLDQPFGEQMLTLARRLSAA